MRQSFLRAQRTSASAWTSLDGARPRAAHGERRWLAPGVDHADEDLGVGGPVDLVGEVPPKILRGRAPPPPPWSQTGAGTGPGTRGTSAGSGSTTSAPAATDTPMLGTKLLSTRRISEMTRRRACRRAGRAGPWSMRSRYQQPHGSEPRMRPSPSEQTSVVTVTTKSVSAAVAPTIAASTSRLRSTRSTGAGPRRWVLSVDPDVHESEHRAEHRTRQRQRPERVTQVQPDLGTPCASSPCRVTRLSECRSHAPTCKRRTLHPRASSSAWRPRPSALGHSRAR